MSAQKRRSKMRNLSYDLTQEEWQECKSFFNDCCAYCGSETDDLEQEHVVPVTYEGAFTKSNIIPSCGRCNRSKGIKNMLDWFNEQEFYTLEKEDKIFEFIGRVLFEKDLT